MYDEIQQAVVRAVSSHKAAVCKLETVEAEYKQRAEQAAVMEQAHEVCQTVALQVQAQAHENISGVVSRCLSTVFEEPYAFKLKWERQRGRTEVAMVFERDGVEVDPMSAAGGGVVDVAAFALRLACLMLHKPATRKCMVLDEPFKFVSADNRHRVRQMLEDLARELDVQFIMVTHIDELKCGTVLELS